MKKAKISLRTQIFTFFFSFCFENFSVFIEMRKMSFCSIEISVPIKFNAFTTKADFRNPSESNTFSFVKILNFINLQHGI